MTPREWPPWAWALATLAATAFGYELSLGRYSLGTAIALMAGSFLGSRMGAYSQVLAAGPAILITGTGLVGSSVEWGYIVGHIAAAAMAGWLAPADEPLQHPRWVWRAAVLMLAAAVPAAMAWQEPWAGLQLRVYYNSVLVMALVIAFYYAMRLVKYPLRVLGFMVALAPFYVLGLEWIMVLAWWQGEPVAGAEGLGQSRLPRLRRPPARGRAVRSRRGLLHGAANIALEARRTKRS